MNLFYAQHISAETKTYIFDKNESHHISRVLRKNIGDSLHITNGKGYLFNVLITNNHPKKTVVEIKDFNFTPEPKHKIHIAITPTKSNDRIEWFLEKATEIGVDEISLLLTEHSERKKVNIDRYEKVIISAMKQSLRVYKPKLNALINHEEFIKNNFKNSQKFIAYCQAEQHLTDSMESKKNTVLLIGPEGGFSDKEHRLALDYDFVPVGLSPNRLRTETAGIVSLCHITLANM